MQVLVRGGEDEESHGQNSCLGTSHEKSDWRPLSHRRQCSRNEEWAACHGSHLKSATPLPVTRNYRKLQLWSLILGRLCIAIFPTSGGTGGTEELLNRAGVALERDWIFPTLVYSRALSSGKAQERS